MHLDSERCTLLLATGWTVDEATEALKRVGGQTTALVPFDQLAAPNADRDAYHTLVRSFRAYIVPTEESTDALLEHGYEFRPFGALVQELVGTAKSVYLLNNERNALLGIARITRAGHTWRAAVGGSCVLSGNGVHERARGTGPSA